MSGKKKICSHCRERKPMANFNKNRSEKDGYHHDCKQCVKMCNRRYYEKNREKLLKQNKAYSKTEKGKLSESKGTKKFRENNPEKKKAKEMARYATITGKLKKQPCEICGDPKVQRHHEDYSKPLEVRWLCAKHHAEIHVLKRRRNETL